MTQDQHSQEETLRQALRRAFSLGQTFWQQADSEYTRQNRKADETAAKFSELVETTVAHLQQRPLPVREGSITAFELAKAAGTKIAPILRALNAGGGDFTVNQELTLEHIGRALASLPVRQEPTDEAEFEIHCNGDHEASACGPRAEAWREIQHYAAQYQQDGPVVIYEVTRTPVSSSPSVQNMGEGETGKDGVQGTLAGQRQEGE